MCQQPRKEKSTAKLEKTGACILATREHDAPNLSFIMKTARYLPILAIVVNAHAAIYQWKDHSGGIHYSDQKPDHASYHRIEEPAPLVIPTPAPPTPAITPEANNPVLAPPQPDFHACTVLVVAIDTLGHTEAVYRDKDGRYHTHRSTFSRFYEGPRQYISDQERPGLLASLKRRLDQQCGDSAESKRALALALEQLTHRYYCALLEKYYTQQANPRLRTPNSELLELHHSIDAYCQADGPGNAPKPVIPTRMLGRD